MNGSLTPLHPSVLRRDQKRFISPVRLTYVPTNNEWVLNSENKRAASDDLR